MDDIFRGELLGATLDKHEAGGAAAANIVPEQLLRLSVYDSSNFVNEIRRIPSFWNSSGTYGPCFAPYHNVSISWEKEVARNVMDGPFYHDRSARRNWAATSRDENSPVDYCRPGFLIIGAGKCGTTFLYQYLVSHPRVLPATEKQVHYFKYYKDRPLKWYLSHFPTATSFLASGALMTGESSPGYLPYPEVPQVLRSKMPGPKIIVIGRDPLERSYSSYRYNYVTIAFEMMKKGKFSHISAGQLDDYYTRYLFSYEDMLRAEIKVLKNCLHSKHGMGARATRIK